MLVLRRSPSPTLAAVLFAVASSAPLRAQVVRGQVSEAGTGESVPGVFVSLVDSAEARRASTLSDAAGRYMVRAPAPGTYTVRAERIGFETVTSEPLVLDGARTVRRGLALPATAVELEGISVSAERRCEVEPGRGGELARIWEEIEKALSVTRWVESSGVARYRVRRFDRRLDPETMTVRDETIRTRTGYAQQPFVAPDPASLARDGYVQRRDGEVFYHAPDVRALQSDGFFRTHCFRVVRGDEVGTFGMVGLEFTPVEDREVPDIRGTLWVDERTAELDRLEFGYTGLEGVRRSEDLGGEVHFRRLPTGAWMVSRWSIRMPVRGRTQQLLLRGRDRNREVLSGVQEVGGEVLEITTAGGEVDIAGDRATLAGVVWDSLRAEPLSGAQVFLNGTGHSTETDEAGEFSLGGLPEGRYALAFHHRRMSERGLSIPAAEVEVTRGQVRRVRLALPSRQGMARAACAELHEAEGVPRDRRAILAGGVEDAVTGTPVPGARVEMEWAGAEGGTGGTRTTETDGSGRYRFCALPGGRTATVRVSFLGRAVGATGIPLTPGEAEIQDLRMRLTPATAVVVTVREHETGEPVQGATVRLARVADPRITDGEGRARFGEVSPGTHALEVEHLAYGTVRDSVRVPAAETVRVRVVMATRAIALDPIEVEVEGRVTTGIGMMGSPEARGTRADVLTTEEIDEVVHRVHDVPSLLRTANVPGLSITDVRLRTGGGDIPAVCIETSRRGAPTMGEGCNMVTVYVDDRRLPDPVEYLMNMNPGDVRRIEVLSPVEASAIYGIYAQNGVVLIYTRTGRPR